MTELTRYTSGTRGYISHAHAQADRDMSRYILQGWGASVVKGPAQHKYRLMMDAADAMSAFEELEHGSTRS